MQDTYTDSRETASVPRKKERRDFEREREQWQRQCCANRDHPTAAKLLACVLAWHFNLRLWKCNGILEAFPGVRELERCMGLSRKPILQAIEALELAGDLQVLRGGNDPETGHRTGNRYRAIMQHHVESSPPGKCCDHSRVQGEPGGVPCGDGSTITSEQTLQYPTDTATVAMPLGFDEVDVQLVTDAILDAGRPLTVGGVIAYLRHHRDDIDGATLARMTSAGRFLRSDKDGRPVHDGMYLIPTEMAAAA